MTTISEKKPVLAVLGPTASGKTALAIEIATRHGCEIVNCDSRQVYLDMQIGTASPTLQEQQLISHHLFNFLSPSLTFSAADYADTAAIAIRKIWKAGKIPLLAGGTGFYYAALSEGLGDAGHDEGRATELCQIAEQSGHAHMVELLLSLDPKAAAVVDTNNLRRVLRAIEIVERTGRPFCENVPVPTLPEAEFFPMVVTRSRPILHASIETRIDRMIADGLEAEVRSLVAKYGRDAGGLNAIGYREWLAYFDGMTTIEAVRNEIIIHTRQYAKRQETWFRRRPGVPPVDIDSPEEHSAIFRKTAAFLKKFGV